MADNGYYCDLTPDELSRANVQVVKRVFGFQVSEPGLSQCASRLGQIIKRNEQPSLSLAIDEAIQGHLPKRQRRGSCLKSAYREALRAAVWYRYDKVAPIVEGKDGTPLEKPLRKRHRFATKA